MRLSALSHSIAATRALTQCEDVLVLGSAALLVADAALGEVDGPLELTRAADLLVQPMDAVTAQMVHEALGEGSLFDLRFGYHADVLTPMTLQAVPPGWQARSLSVAGATVLGAADVCAMKLCVGRDKDLQIVATLLERELVQRHDLVAMLHQLALSKRDLRTALRRLDRVLVRQGPGQGILAQAATGSAADNWRP